MIYYDCHLHSNFSGDSDTPPEEQIKKALSMGLHGICFTDHHDYDVVSDIDFELDIPAYMEEISRLKELYEGKIEILTGIELGIQLHIGDYLKKLVDTYPFDLVIGSMHFIDGLDPYYDQYFTLHGKNAYRRFFEKTLERIENVKCYDTLGHLDYVIRYGAAHGLTYSYSEYSDVIDAILKRLISDGKAPEINSGGLARGLSQPNPGKEVILRYRELGGEVVTIGSDAHTPAEMGFRFEECAELLRNCGFEYYGVYKKRIPVMYRL